LAGLLCCAAGCTTLPALNLPWQKPRLDAEAGLYKSAALTYTVDAGRQSLPISVARVEGERVSYDRVPSPPQAGSSLGTLTAQFPHPAGRDGMAQMRLVIESDTSPRLVWWNPTTYGRAARGTAADAIHEEWLLDISKADFDQILDQLRREGFFVQDAPHVAASVLSVTYDGRKVRKNWGQVAVLEGTMQRVRHEGQLIALHRPAAPAGATQLATSVDAYRALVAQGGGGDSQLAVTTPQSGLMMPGPGALPPNYPLPGPSYPSPYSTAGPTQIARVPDGPH
jgi:hypothetical protein